jgi:2-haloacid dehalogenase
MHNLRLPKVSSAILKRRDFLSTSAASGLALQTFASEAAGSPPKIQAVAFDGFAILDPRPVFDLVDQIYPERGADLSNLWRSRQFEYMWLRTLSRQYSDFWQVTGDALVFATKALNVDFTPQKHSRLMEAYLKLRCWPEVPAALRALRGTGTRLALLSNLTAEILQAGIRNSELEGLFDQVLSTDLVRAYKPDPRAYRMGLHALGLDSGQILFAAYAGWDAAGAKAFGYPVYWVNRQRQPAEELGVRPDGTGSSLDDLEAWVEQSRKRI